MKETKISVTNDYIFKKIFAKKGKESILKDFLIGVLKIPIKKIRVQAEVSLEKQLEENKLGRLDIIAILDNDNIVNIEMQISYQYDFIERSLYYWSGMYYNELKSGREYKGAKRTISVNILDFEMFEEGPYHEVGRLRRDYENKLLTDKIEIHYIQIPKFKKEKRGTKTKLDQWMHFIVQENKKEVELAMKENKEIRKANEEYEYLTGNEAERRLAYLRDKAIRDENSMKAGAREEGKKEGREEGREEGKKDKQIEIAKKLIEMKMKIEDIQEATGLTKEEIENI